MYDADKRAAFMRNLFAERIDATRRLLESAGKSEVTEDYKKAAHTLTEDAGAVFPELHVAQTDPEYLPDDSELEESAAAEPPEPAKKDPGPAPNGGLTPEQVAAALEDEKPAPVRPPERTDRADPGDRTDRTDRVDATGPGGDTGASEPALAPPRGRSATKVALRVAAVLAVAGVAAALAWSRIQPAPPPAPPPTIVTEPVVVKPASRPSPPDPAPDPVVEDGTLALSTTPRCKVMEAGKMLGQTPLVDVSLPPGPHILTLVPDSGPARRLELKIEPGKTTKLNQRLASLPKARR
jgi:serine/threonine-protein kinase